MSQFVLYDLPSKGRCASWSMNPWKTRLSLNYKGIDYTTEFVEYPDIAPRWKELGVEPNPGADSEPRKYTVPLAKFPDSAIIMDSRSIATRMEEVYPEPSLHLDYLGLKKVYEHADGFLETTRPFWMPLIPLNVLSPRSAEYFKRTRAERFGMPLEQYGKEQGREERWTEAKVHAKALGDMLREHDGPYFMGQTVSFADFVVVGVLHCMRRADPEEVIFTKTLELDPTFEVLYKACSKWLERDDH